MPAVVAIVIDFNFSKFPVSMTTFKARYTKKTSNVKNDLLINKFFDVSIRNIDNPIKIANEITNKIRSEAPWLPVPMI
jgi:hypothetical protein